MLIHLIFSLLCDIIILYLLVNCGLLKSPSNGVVISNGHTAYYYCYRGFVTNTSNNTRYCMDNGKWSGNNISCIGKLAVN